MKTSLPLLILAAAALLPFPIQAQTATPTPTATPNVAPTFAQAVALYKALPSTATNTDKVAALNAIVTASDIPADQVATYTYKLGGAQRTASPHNYTVFVPTLFAAYQAGSLDAFLDYLQGAIAEGGTAATAAIGQTPAFATANPGNYALSAQALAAEGTANRDQAFAFWNNVITTNPNWNRWRGMAVVHAGQLSIARGDTPQQTNTILIPLLTSGNVHTVDMNYVWAYRMVNRSTVSVNGSIPVITPTELKSFLQGILNCVDLLNINQAFLTQIQSQLAAAN